jgi:hypothetical protein
VPYLTLKPLGSNLQLNSSQRVDEFSSKVPLEQGLKFLMGAVSSAAKATKLAQSDAEMAAHNLIINSFIPN